MFETLDWAGAISSVFPFHVPSVIRRTARAPPKELPTTKSGWVTLTSFLSWFISELAQLDTPSLTICFLRKIVTVIQTKQVATKARKFGFLNVLPFQMLRAQVAATKISNIVEKIKYGFFAVCRIKALRFVRFQILVWRFGACTWYLSFRYVAFQPKLEDSIPWIYKICNIFRFSALEDIMLLVAFHS